MTATFNVRLKGWQQISILVLQAANVSLEEVAMHSQGDERNRSFEHPPRYLWSDNICMLFGRSVQGHQSGSMLMGGKGEKETNRELLPRSHKLEGHWSTHNHVMRAHFSRNDMPLCCPKRDR